jgi:type IV secretory pathway TrbD component
MLDYSSRDTEENTMLPILAALVVLTLTGVISAWFIVLYALGIVFVGVHAWRKQKRRQNAFRVHRGPTIDL